MRLRKPLSLVGAVVTGTLLASASWAGDTSSKMSQATATAEECAGMTGANRTDCEKRAREQMSSSSSSSATNSDSTSSDHSMQHEQSKTSSGSDSAAYGSASSDRTRVSQRDTDMESSSDEGRGENKSPAPSANGTTMDWNQTNPAATSGSPAAETQRGPARTDAPLTQDSSSDSERDNRSTASDGTDSN
jgi:trimeric autotransporter adhesin